MEFYECDLHTHTTNSDGRDIYEEIILNAKRRGVKILAITDHDITPLETIEAEGEKISPKDYAKRNGIYLIPGIEYSCDTDVEDVHILGLGCNFSDPGFSEEQLKIEKSKIDTFKALVEAINEKGFKITWEEVLNQNSAHTDANVQKKHIFELMAKHGMTKTWKEAKILTQVEHPYVDFKREKILPQSAINLIHKSGGIAILAHPYLIDEVTATGIKRRDYIESIISFGIDGIEAAYPYSKTSYKGSLTDKHIEDEVKKAYENRLKIISGGSDYHNDSKIGLKVVREIGEKGVTLKYFMSNKYLRQLIEE
ncbi:MAG: PHP domain-containing protein [Eubacteriales bacterium]